MQDLGSSQMPTPAGKCCTSVSEGAALIQWELDGNEILGCQVATCVFLHLFAYAFSWFAKCTWEGNSGPCHYLVIKLRCSTNSEALEQHPGSVYLKQKANNFSAMHPHPLTPARPPRRVMQMSPKWTQHALSSVLWLGFPAAHGAARPWDP